MTSKEWNKRYPVGTCVKYFPVKGQAEFIETKTRSDAWDLDCGIPVVSIEGRSGGIALNHLLPVRITEPKVLDRDCVCLTCNKEVHHLGIASHRAAHRRKKEDCTIRYSAGDTYRHAFAEPKEACTHDPKQI